MNLETELSVLLDGVLKAEDLSEDTMKKWSDWKSEEIQLEQEVHQWLAEKELKETEEKNLRRNQDFAIAFDRLTRAGYKGKHGNFEVPRKDRDDAMELYNRVNKGIEENWDDATFLKFTGKTKADLQRAFIRRVNEIVCAFGWNPPADWQ